MKPPTGLATASGASKEAGAVVGPEMSDIVDVATEMSKYMQLLSDEKIAAQRDERGFQRSWEGVRCVMSHDMSVSRFMCSAMHPRNKAVLTSFLYFNILIYVP